jgi:hypothetical protein
MSFVMRISPWRVSIELEIFLLLFNPEKAHTKGQPNSEAEASN